MIQGFGGWAGGCVSFSISRTDWTQRPWRRSTPPHYSPMEWCCDSIQSAVQTLHSNSSQAQAFACLFCWLWCLVVCVRCCWMDSPSRTRPSMSPANQSCNCISRHIAWPLALDMVLGFCSNNASIFIVAFKVIHSRGFPSV